MSAPLAYGIDFGTTNSSLAIAYSDAVEMLPIRGTGAMAQCLPSIAYLDRQGLRRAGADAVDLFMITGHQHTRCDRCPLVLPDGRSTYSQCRQYQRGGGCQDSRLIAELKSELSSLEFDSTHSWAIDFTLEDLTAVILDELKRRADAHCGQQVTRAAIGHPIAFFGAGGTRFAAQQERAEDRLRRAALRAGFETVLLFPEPAAAVLDESLPEGISLSVDFGGGTFDVAVMEIRGDEGEVVALQGVGIGGSTIDAELFDAKVAPLIGLGEDQQDHRLPIPHWFIHKMRTLGGIKHLLTSPEAPSVVDEIRRRNPAAANIIDSVLYGGQAHRFYTAIENAKIDLSNQTRSEIDFQAPGVSLQIPLLRAELDALAAPHLEAIRAVIMDALEAAGAGSEDVQVVIRTGGSSQLAAFIATLGDMFGLERVRSRNAFTSVAQGLGVVAQEEWA